MSSEEEIRQLKGEVTRLHQELAALHEAVRGLDVTIDRFSLEIMESGSGCFYSPSGIGVSVRLSDAAKRLVHEGLAPREERRARRGRKPK